MRTLNLMLILPVNAKICGHRVKFGGRILWMTPYLLAKKISLDILRSLAVAGTVCRDAISFLFNAYPHLHFALLDNFS